jgi:hypothetical protein
MSEPPLSLGTIALIHSKGNPNHALADLMTQVVGMCGFIHKLGAPQEKVLEVFDTMNKSSRKALINIMEEDDRGHQAKA